VSRAGGKKCDRSGLERIKKKVTRGQNINGRPVATALSQERMGQAQVIKKSKGANGKEKRGMKKRTTLQFSAATSNQ